MKRLKFFDRYQLIITIIGVAAFALAATVFIPMFLTGKVIYDENGVMQTIEYNLILQSLYSVFSFINVLALVWFVARAATYKMRVKEEDSL
ncbi:MAG: hypothetical protein J5666_08790 [Bacilli bacterium]|nr:hypothetical protein [Bacilli bacterium]